MYFKKMMGILPGGLVVCRLSFRELWNPLDQWPLSASVKQHEKLVILEETLVAHHTYELVYNILSFLGQQEEDGREPGFYLDWFVVQKIRHFLIGKLATE